MISRLDRLQGRDIYENTALAKLNEVIDAVNELQEAFESIHPCFNYKDRLNWIGRRCNFSNDCENWIEDIFVNIDRTDSEPEIPKYRALNGKLYKYCELVTEQETPADPYAEQRKWIGKLCWFWSGNFKKCGILTAVFDNNEYGEGDLTEEYPFQRDSIGCWQHCEPVKPDDDIIYKGE